MKKIIAIMLALWAFAAFSVVAGCKKATEPTTSEEQQGTEGGAEEAPAPEQPAEGQE